MVKEVLNDKSTYEQRSKGSHGARTEVSERRVFLTEAKVTAKGLI